MKNLVLTTFLIISQLVFCQENDRPEREAFELELKINEEEYFSADIEKAPFFVAPNALQIYPSDQLNIEVEVKDGQITSMKVVKEITNPEKTIILDFKQEVEGKTHKHMILSVKNPFEKKLNYDAYMLILGHESWINTSIIAVYPKISGNEMWQDVIISLALDNWRLED